MNIGELQALLDHVTEQLIDLKQFSEENPTHHLVLRTDLERGTREILMRRSEGNTLRFKMKFGDVIGNLRSLIDNAYFLIVSPHVPPEKRKQVQFPFCEKKSELEATVKRRHALSVSQEFYNTILDVKPHGEDDGSVPFKVIHELDIVKKHKFPNPVAGLAGVNSEDILKQVPDFPFNLSHCIHSGDRLFSWPAEPILMKATDLGQVVPPTMNVYEKLIDLPMYHQVTCEKYPTVSVYLNHMPSSRFGLNGTIDHLYEFAVELTNRLLSFEREIQSA